VEEALDEAVYTIDGPYIYPLTPAMEEEWKDAWDKGSANVYKACEVPQELVENMTTKALLQTALDYPFSVAKYAFDTPEMAFTAALSSNRALGELCKRPDAMRELMAYEMDTSHFPANFDEDTKISLLNSQLEVYVEFVPIFYEWYTLELIKGERPIDEPYEYPSKAEWDSLNEAEKYFTCNISRELMKRMTTKALLQTVLDCPRLRERFGHDTSEENFVNRSSHCGALDFFYEREDAMEELLAYEAGDTLTNSYIEAMIEFQPKMYRRKHQ
jgi:hypothetical protein